ncbi:MAG: SapC family protein [Cognaticolwellia aestuarii]
MANPVPVRKEQHQNLKIAAKRSLSHIADQHIVPITVAEYAQGSTSYPIFIVKEPESDRYRSVAMLGLESGENLFLNGDDWTALYAPQSVGMVPFALGLDPEKEKTLTACIDIDSDYVGEDKDLPLFEENGDESELFKSVQDTLGRLYDNEVLTEKFINELVELNLLEEIELVVTNQSGEKKKIVGIHTINEKKLRELADEQVLDFHKRGMFVPIHSMLGSIGQVNRLAQLRNQHSDKKIAGVQVVSLQPEAATA